MSTEVHQLNADARRLLLYIHGFAIQRPGSAFVFHGGPKALAETGLDEERLKRAKGRLIQMGLAKWAGAGPIAITNAGIRTAEDEALLDRELPVATRKRATEVPSDVADSLAEVRKTALDFVSDDDLRKILERDLDELEGAVTGGLNKCVAMLGGSIAEALLVDVLDRRRDVAQTHMQKHKKFPEDASLEKLVEIAVEEKLIELAGAALVNTVSNYRDLIHPDRERRTKTRISPALTSALLSLLRLVVHDFHAATTDGRLSTYVSK